MLLRYVPIAPYTTVKAAYPEGDSNTSKYAFNAANSTVIIFSQTVFDLRYFII